jgi:hypothetical protein
MRKEYASYQEIDAFLSFRIRGLSDSMEEPSSVTENLRNKCRSSVNNVSVLKCDNYIALHSLPKVYLVKDFCRYQSGNAVLLLGKSEFVSIVYGRVISYQNAQINRDMRIVVACITRCYISQKRSLR